MSQTHSIGCKDCQVSLWVGQDYPDAYLYGEKENLSNFVKFLMEHSMHNLIFYTDGCSEELDGYSDFDGKQG